MVDTGVKKTDRRIRKADVIVVTGVVVIGAVLLLLWLFLRKPGNTVIVSVDGREVAGYLLTDTVDVDVADLVPGMTGSNRLIIRGGEAWIEEADCPDRLCVGQGHISHTGESIVCLPHRVTIRIEGEKDEAVPDAIVSFLSGEVSR